MTDQHTNETPERPARPGKRKPEGLQAFKENYLPWLIILLGVILVIVFISGSARRAMAWRKARTEASIAASESQAKLEAELKQESESLVAQADKLAKQFDYQGAIDTLDSFSGDISKYPLMVSRRAEYVRTLSEFKEYSDPAAIPNLSFQMLIADPKQAFQDDTYGDAYNKNYVTIDEFSKILQQLYDNGYMLVRLHDLVNVSVDGSGNPVFAPNKLYLPTGKKPIVLTQTAANYYTYMTDGDGDRKPDKDGDGFPFRLTLDDKGQFVSEMVDAQGQVQTGNLDFVTILESFIREHPDFSFNGARAVLAVTGYDGIFGYRINAQVKELDGAEFYNQQAQEAARIADALRKAGYELGCYSFENISYSDASMEMLTGDLNRWKEEIVPVMGEADIFVYPYGDDIVSGLKNPYEGEKYEALRKAGFRYFVGQDQEKPADAFVAGDYFRNNRRLVTGSYMAHHAEYFADLFDASKVLNSQRGEVPG